MANFLKSFSRLLGFGRNSEAEPEEAEEALAVPPADRPIVTLATPAARRKKDTLPRFKLSGTNRSSEPAVRARAELRSVFTPAQPVTDRRLFAGRVRVTAQLIEIIEERLSHVVVFGERGIGKTSLMHILADLASESRYLVLRATCGANSEFSETFRTLLKDIPLLYSTTVSPTEHEEVSSKSFADLLPEGDVDARKLSEILADVTGTRILIILDEYDRLQNEQFRQGIAELIKNLSDQAAPVQLIIAGVSSNLHELVGYIPSIRRNVIGLPMPRLEKDEVAAIMKMGEDYANVKFEDSLVELIHMLSNGSPYMVRLLCHHASLIALDDGRMRIVQADIAGALDRMVEEAEGRLSYQTTQRVRQLDLSKSSALLGIVSRAASTADGWFAKSDIFSITGNSATTDSAVKLITAELAKGGLMAEEKGPIESRYKFTDEGLANFIWTMIAREQFRSSGKKAA